MFRRLTILLFVCLVVGLASSGGAAFDPDTDPALVAWWPLDGDATDSGPNGLDGTVMGDPDWSPGKFGMAVDLDGTDDYIDCGNPDPLTIRDELTVSCWFKVESFTRTWESILAKGDNSYRLSRGPGTGNGTHMGISGTSASPDYFNAPTIVTDNKWHHIAGVYDGTQAIIYIDGKEDMVYPSTGQINASTYSLFIGENSQARDRYLNGLVDDVRIYNRALTADEVKSMVPPQLKAFEPKPADGDPAATMPLLQWTQGDTALFHNVYLGTTPELTEADLKAANQPFTMYYHTQGLEPGVTYYWRVDEIEADMVTIHTGDLWSFTSQALTAYLPTPADGAVDASTAPTLTWLPGQLAMTHRVYFADNLDAVTQGAAEADQGEVEEPTFEPGALEPVTDYFWRVDETVASGEVKAGPVWTFSTVLPVDGFDDYTDDEGSRIYETWIDGWTNGTGSTVGNVQAPFAEQTIVYSGIQSMPVDYNNVNSPFYSEAEQEFSPTRDWTVGGVDTLVLYVRGRGGNDPDVLYVALEDSAGATATVNHPDETIVKSSSWVSWPIPLSDFAGVNAARIKKLYIGVGDKADPKPGGAGRIYIDDIRVTKP